MTDGEAELNQSRNRRHTRSQNFVSETARRYTESSNSRLRIEDYPSRVEFR